MTGVPIDSNVGGYFGPYLKFGGWDALELQGKADVETIVFIDSNDGTRPVLRGARGPAVRYPPPGRGADARIRPRRRKTCSRYRSSSAGRGADHSPMGLLNFSLYDKRRQGIRVKQAGRGGIGTVLRDKKIRAVVCRLLAASSRT